MDNNTLLQKIEEPVIKEFEENSISKPEVIQGLCSTCNNSSSCYYHLRNGKRIVCFCELFDDYEPSAQIGDFSLLDEFIIKPNTPRTNKVKLSGLCMNCENRNTCTYQKPESGVWHCEEYC